MKAFLSFLVRVLTGTPATIAMLTKLSGPTLAALLAVFYDLIKFLLLEAEGAEAIASGNVQAGISTILSEQTRSLVAAIVTDYKAAKTTVVDDLHQLGIAGPVGSGTNASA